MALYLYLSVSGENRIARYSVDRETGYLQLRENTELENGPAPLAVDPQQRFLYAGLRGLPCVPLYRQVHLLYGHGDQ